VHNDVQELHQGSARAALGVVQELHIKHPSLNTQLNTYIKPYSPLDQFDEFYSAYPKKVGRQAAVKAWKKLSPQPALINRILEDLRQRVEQGHWCTGKDKKYIPGPAPYLNGVMWEDEIIPKTGYTSPTDFAQLCADTQDLTENI